MRAWESRETPAGSPRRSQPWAASSGLFMVRSRTAAPRPRAVLRLQVFLHFSARVLASWAWGLGEPTECHAEKGPALLSLS